MASLKNALRKDSYETAFTFFAVYHQKYYTEKQDSNVAHVYVFRYSTGWQT